MLASQKYNLGQNSRVGQPPCQLDTTVNSTLEMKHSDAERLQKWAKNNQSVSGRADFKPNSGPRAQSS